MTYVWGNNETQFFFELTPELILTTVGKHGLSVTGRCMALNSMENRVYEVEIDNEKDFPKLANPSVVVKFYRPGRWSEQQILEEHEFINDLEENEIPVIAPLALDGKTLFQLEDHKIYYTIFPKKGGRAPDEMNGEQLDIVGRMLARLHNTGSVKKASHRIQISPQSFGLNNLDFILSQKLIAPHLEDAYKDVVTNICTLASNYFKDIKVIRIHGDCHCGNIISRADEGMFFIDFDDMLMGPAVQDIWLITPDDEQGQGNNLNRQRLLDSYQTMRDFDFRELKLVEFLRSFRFIHFSAWIGKRWDDPAFKNAFPHYADAYYWEIQTQDLRNQYQLIQTLLQ